MAQPLCNSLLPLNDAARLLPGPMSARRLYGWIRRGVRHIYLEAVWRGPLLFTSRDRIDRFLDRLEDGVADLADGEALLKEAGL